MEVIIHCEAKEIAALVIAVQERQFAEDVKMNTDAVVHCATELIQNLSKRLEAKRDSVPTIQSQLQNYQYGRWTVIVWSYLNQFLTSGTAPWVLLDSRYNQTYGGAVWNDRIQLAVRSTVDENTDANVWRGRSRFNATFNDWRFAAVGGITGGTTLAPSAG